MSSNMSPQELRAAIEEKQQERTDACMEEIRAILEKHQCALQFVETRINGQLVRTAWAVIPADQ